MRNFISVFCLLTACATPPAEPLKDESTQKSQDPAVLRQKIGTENSTAITDPGLGGLAQLSLQELSERFERARPPKNALETLPSGVARIYLLSKPLAHSLKDFSNALWSDRNFKKGDTFESRRSYLGSPLRGRYRVTAIQNLIQPTESTVPDVDEKTVVPVRGENAWVLDFSRSQVTLFQGVLEEYRALSELTYLGRIFLNGQFYAYSLLKFEPLPLKLNE